jgi:hypothetical protein
VSAGWQTEQKQITGKHEIIIIMIVMMMMMMMITATVISIYLTKLQWRRYLKNNVVLYQLGTLERVFNDDNESCNFNYCCSYLVVGIVVVVVGVVGPGVA